MELRSAALAFGLLGGLVVGCHGEPIEPLAADTGVVTDAADAGTDASDTSEAGSGASCPYVHGSKMVRIDATAGSYCIDVTEVTVGQFNEFVLASSPFDAPPFCASLAGALPTRDVGSDQSFPKGNVQWCWAHSYCKWAGKRLCGRIGATGWDVPIDARGEWTYACQNGILADKYPYGDVYQASTCNTEGGSVVAVGKSSACHGIGAPYDKVTDMLGNVAELEGFVGFLESGAPSAARSRGNTSLDGDHGCGDYADFGFETPWVQVGFRCCDDP